MKDQFPLLLHETASAWRNALDKRLKHLGLSQAKWRTLLHLSYANKPLTQTELANRMGIEGATLVGLLDRLANDGWIERRLGSRDRRSKEVHLTAKAHTTLNKIRDTANKLRDELLTPITNNEIEICSYILQRIRAQASGEHHE